MKIEIKNRWTGSVIFSAETDSFKLAVEQGKEGPADFIHSLYFVLVGPDGGIRGYYDSTDPAAMDRLKGDLRKMVDDLGVVVECPHAGRKERSRVKSFLELSGGRSPECGTGLPTPTSGSTPTSSGT